MGDITERIIKTFESTGKFSVESVDLNSDEAQEWVEFVINPKRFLPEIFDGLWAKSKSHPKPGLVKIVRVMKGNDQIYRAIGRQNEKIYATPWI